MIMEKLELIPTFWKIISLPKKGSFLNWIEAISYKILLTSPQKTNSVGEKQKFITKFEKDLSASEIDNLSESTPTEASRMLR